MTEFTVERIAIGVMFAMLMTQWAAFRELKKFVLELTEIVKRNIR